MDLIFADEGLEFVLQRIVGSPSIGTGGLWWKVFTNNVTPGRSTVLSDLTIDGTDFPTFQLDDTDLTTATLTSDTQYLQGSVINFTNGSGSPINVYGYAILDETATHVVAAARLDGAPIAVAAAASLPVLPVLINRSQLP